MGTWSTISTSEMPEELVALFVKHFGDNLSGKRHLFMTVGKTLSPAVTIDDFARCASEIANELEPIRKCSAPIWVSLLCDEAGSPVVISIEPKNLTVLFAGHRNREHIESYRAFIEGTPEHALYLTEKQKQSDYKAAREAKRERLRAKGQLYRPATERE